jgi:hypothetical protein
MPRSRMSRSYTPLPPSAFMACSGTALFFVRMWIHLSIAALLPTNMDLCVEKSVIFSMCTQIINCGYIKPDTTYGKTMVGEGLLYEVNILLI